jgi:diguanylate cyclase (GGDEF)-like protein
MMDLRQQVRARVRMRREELERPRAIGVGARILVVLLCLGALAATVYLQLEWPHRETVWTTFLFLAAASAFAQLFGVHTTHNQSYHLAIVFVLAGVLLLPPWLVALLCVLQHVPEWRKERYPIEIQGFNIANYTLAALGGVAAAHVVLGTRSAGADSRTAVAGALAGIVFVVVNHGVLAGMLRVARGHSLKQSGLFTFESLSTDLVLALIGVGLAAWWNVNLWLVPVAVAPLVLIHRALSIPRLRAQASLDAKTGLYNAGYLKAALEDEIERARRFGRPLSVMVADLDLLRQINNTHGHLSGDAVLLGVAEILHQELRPFDVAARFGGEEFAVVLPETEFEDALGIADRIRAAVERRSFKSRGSDQPVPATLSIGVSSFPLHAGDPDELVHQADLALYRAKAEGRNRVCGAVTRRREALAEVQEVA